MCAKSIVANNVLEPNRQIIKWGYQQHVKDIRSFFMKPPNDLSDLKTFIVAWSLNNKTFIFVGKNVGYYIIQLHFEQYANSPHIPQP